MHLEFKSIITSLGWANHPTSHVIVSINGNPQKHTRHLKN